MKGVALRLSAWWPYDLGMETNQPSGRAAGRVKDHRYQAMCKAIADVADDMFEDGVVMFMETVADATAWAYMRDHCTECQTECWPVANDPDDEHADLFVWSCPVCEHTWQGYWLTRQPARMIVQADPE